jgi:hypothetical protein
LKIVLRELVDGGIVKKTDIPAGTDRRIVTNLSVDRALPLTESPETPMKNVLMATATLSIPCNVADSLTAQLAGVGRSSLADFAPPCLVKNTTRIEGGKIDSP